MKKLIYLVFLSSFISCSNFSEDLNLAPTATSFSTIETDLPVINVVADAAGFDQLLAQPDVDLEIEGMFNLYRDKQLVIANEAVELSIKGGFSTRFPLKSLGIKFEKKYDNTDRSLIHPKQLLPHHNIDEIKAIRLRNSGSDFRNTMLKDLSMTQLAIDANLDIDLTYGTPALVYVNEEFYGLMNLRTEANTNGMAGLNGVKKSAITLAKITTLEFIKKDGDFDRIDRFVDAIEQQDIAYVKSELAINSFIDYMIFESYLGNTDWPHNNARFYAVDEEPFRFVLFDLDKVAWLSIHKSPLAIIDNKQQKNIITDLFFLLYSEEAFQEAFWNRYQFLLEKEAFSFDKFKTIVNHNTQQIEAFMPLQITQYNHPNSMMQWQVELDKMLLLFQERERVVQEFVADL